MARCSRRAMRPAAVMGAFYRAMLDALVRSEWRDPSRRIEPVEAAEALAGAAPRDFMTARRLRARGGRVHVVGAGLAGLAASVTLAGDGRRVVLYEAGSHAGGRCRSFIDSELGVRIDNGNHLLLSGNRAALSYVERIGALDTFERPAEAAIPFVDLADGARWEVRPSRGAVPWWIFRPSRRVPGTRMRDYLAALRLGGPAPATRSRRCWTATRCCSAGCGSRSSSRRSIPRPSRPRPRCSPVSSPRRSGAARRRAGRCWRATGCRKASSIPALEYLTRHGGEIRFGTRLKALGLRGRPRRRAALRRRHRPGTAAMRMSCSRCRRRSRRGSCPASSCRTITRRSSTPISAMARPRGPAVSRDCRRHGGMGVSQARYSVGDGQRRRPDCRPSGRRIARHAVARRGAGSRACPARRPRRPASSRSAVRHSAPPRRSWRAVPLRPRYGTIFTLQAIMSILACLPRSKALFAQASWRRAASPDAATRNWRRSDFRPRRHRSRQPTQDCERALP